jgi:hypothetical protein
MDPHGRIIGCKHTDKINNFIISCSVKGSNIHIYFTMYFKLYGKVSIIPGTGAAICTAVVAA